MSYNHWWSNHRGVGFNAQVNISITLTLWIYPTPKHLPPLKYAFLWHFWVRHNGHLHQNVIGKSRRRPCNCDWIQPMAAKPGWPYPVCLVLATNPLFMSNLLRVPYGLTVWFMWYVIRDPPRTVAIDIRQANCDMRHISFGSYSSHMLCYLSREITIPRQMSWVRTVIFYRRMGPWWVFLMVHSYVVNWN